MVTFLWGTVNIVYATKCGLYWMAVLLYEFIIRQVSPWKRTLKIQSAKSGISNVLASKILDNPCLLKAQQLSAWMFVSRKTFFADFCASLGGFSSKTEPQQTNV